MSRVRVEAFSVSIDGFGAGPNQSIRNPLGMGAEGLHEWMLPTRTFQSRVMGKPSGTTGIDDDFAARSFDNVGAWIMGRNMFGPIRGEWPDASWRGWWGENPPYHFPVFVLTHYARESLVMEGDTTFHFVTGGIHEALERAREASGERDIRIGGGASTIRQYLEAGLIDELHIAISPMLLGSGEPLFGDVNALAAGYRCEKFEHSEKATHLLLRRSDTPETPQPAA
ncbi:MAG TPA: dihydrofolate reductase family protein [Gemmatimonadales bacterium]|nr:dihydrofolate reductase family protein [Gemmatimonadales bacterium]